MWGVLLGNQSRNKRRPERVTPPGRDRPSPHQESGDAFEFGGGNVVDELCKRLVVLRGKSIGDSSQPRQDDADVPGRHLTP